VARAPVSALLVSAPGPRDSGSGFGGVTGPTQAQREERVYMGAYAFSCLLAASFLFKDLWSEIHCYSIYSKSES